MSAAPRPAAGRATGTAGGKVILLGEHAVVYGTPALVAGVDKGLQARVIFRPGHEELSTLEAGEQTVHAAKEGESPLARAWAALLATGAEPGPLHGVVAGSLPAGVGLGHSAAAGVALARAVERLHTGGEPVDAAVRERAMAWERVFHGNPSGVDVEAAMRGGLLLFARGQGVTPVAAGGRLVLCIGLTGEPSATRTMVAHVAELRARQPDRAARAIAAIERLVERATEALRSGDAATLGALLDDNQERLAELEVSTDGIEQMCSAARAAGAFGAKLTGAGGGGAVIALAGVHLAGKDDDAARRARRISDAWRAQGRSAITVYVGAASGPSAPPRRGRP